MENERRSMFLQFLRKTSGARDSYHISLREGHLYMNLLHPVLNSYHTDRERLTVSTAWYSKYIESAIQYVQGS
jgi:hypothetical protein